MEFFLFMRYSHGQWLSKSMMSNCSAMAVTLSFIPHVSCSLLDVEPFEQTECFSLCKILLSLSYL